MALRGTNAQTNDVKSIKSGYGENNPFTSRLRSAKNQAQGKGMMQITCDPDKSSASDVLKEVKSMVPQDASGQLPKMMFVVDYGSQWVNWKT